MMRRRGLLILLCFTSYLAFKEYLSVISTRRADRRTLLLAYASIPAQYYIISIRWYGLFVVFIPVFLLMVLSARMAVVETTGYHKVFFVGV